MGHKAGGGCLGTSAPVCGGCPSHELRTPLTVILSNIHLLVQSEDINTDKSLLRLGHIEAESERMKQLVESLLTLARSDSGKEAAVYRPLDMSYVVNNSAMTFEPHVFDMGKSITSQGTPLTKEEIKHIFLRFYRSDPARSQIPGYGMGLSIAETIVLEHSGSIEAASDGRDQTFTVWLPLITI